MVEYEGEVELICRRSAEVESSLGAYRRKAAQLDQRIKHSGLKLEVYGRDREREDRAQLVTKAIVDEELCRGQHRCHARSES